MNSLEKRNSVKRNYDLIANQYCDEFGVEIEDKQIVDEFKSLLQPKSTVIDLGGGSGKVAKYLIDNSFNGTCYDFSKGMMKNALSLFPNLPYILDDMLYLKKYFGNESIDGIVALYSLFHIPKGDMKILLKDIREVLKTTGYFLASFQLGKGEQFVDEPYLNEKGNKVLFMNYYSKEEILDLFKENGFEIIDQYERKETGDNVIGEDGNDAIFILAKKTEFEFLG